MLNRSILRVQITYDIRTPMQTRMKLETPMQYTQNGFSDRTTDTQSIG